MSSLFFVSHGICPLVVGTGTTNFGFFYQLEVVTGDPKKWHYLQLQSNVTQSKLNIFEPHCQFLTELRDFAVVNSVIFWGGAPGKTKMTLNLLSLITHFTKGLFIFYPTP